jgi:NAD(P)-dependent dehydrogenase (short-subunit alcohol dehydrogenase family)
MGTVEGSVLVVGVGQARGWARQLHGASLQVAIRSRSPGATRRKLAQTVAEIRATGAIVASVVGDACRREDADRFVAAAQALAPLALAVHNAGSNEPTPFLKLTESASPTIARARARWLPDGRGRAAGAAGVRRRQPHLHWGASGSLRGKAKYAPFAAAKAALQALAQSLAREFGPQNIHVGHVIIDGGIEGQRLLSRVPGLVEQRGPDGLLKIDAIADAYWTLHHQHRSAWTQEMDLRPWAGNF